MSAAVYCMSPDEHRANAILTALRGAGFNSEISVVIGDHADSRDMSVKEDAVRGVKVGSVIGALVALALPGIGEVLVMGPLLAALTGAAAGGAVGGLAGGSGAAGMWDYLGLSRNDSTRECLKVRFWFPCIRMISQSGKRRSPFSERRAANISIRNRTLPDLVDMVRECSVFEATVSHWQQSCKLGSGRGVVQSRVTRGE